MRPAPLLGVLLLVALLLAGAAKAQCAIDWSPGPGQPFLSGRAQCTHVWDPDGAGPLPARLLVGGQQLIGGSANGKSVMSWDGSQWSALGSGPGTTGGVRVLTTWNGTLIAGGSFNGGGFQRVAAWTGTAWQPLGTGLAYDVRALLDWNGDLVAIAYEQGAGPSQPYLRRWNGTAWIALPLPPLLHEPKAAVVYQGHLLVGGATGTTGVLERWNGTSWTTSITATGPYFGSFDCLAVRTPPVVGASTVLFVGGTFSSIGSTAVANIAKTSGGTTFTFTPVGSGLTASCRQLLVRNTILGDYTIVAAVLAAQPQVRRFTSSNGQWAYMHDEPIASVAYFNSEYLGTMPTNDKDALFRWNGTLWLPVIGEGIDGDVRAATRIGDEIVIGGSFTSVPGGAASRVARWDGTSFQPLGTGIGGPSVDALVPLATGDLIAGGWFSTAGGVAANNIARWNGSGWSPLGSGLGGPVRALCRMPNGDVVAGGAFTTAGGVPCARVARWNGASWSPLGSGVDADVLGLAVRDDGVLFAGGYFSTAGGNACARIAQWNGTSWSPLGSGCDHAVHGLALVPGGDLIAVGEFSHAGGIAAKRCARWTGGGWTSMGAVTNATTFPRAVLALANGDVVVGHGFTGFGDNASGIARWNGSTWAGLDTGLRGATTDEPVQVQALAQRRDGSLVVGGTFSVAGDVVARNLTTARSTCMPVAAAYGAGCSGPAGLLAITADTLPWVGATFRTTTTGVPLGSLCLGVIGLQPLSFPLDQLLPEGQPGCALLTTLDITMVLPTGLGTTTSSFSLTNDPSLLGVVFFQQTLPLSFDASGALAAVRGSNALALLIGTL